MFSLETWLAYTSACILIILAPGPDNILAIGRGLSQGKIAAITSSLGAGLGLMIHVFAASLGFTVMIKTSATVFWVVKIVGATYLIWLGVKALRSRNLISFSKVNYLPLKSIFVSGFLTTTLNPKPAFFIFAFIPQFVVQESGSVTIQTLVLGSWLALLGFIIFSIMGSFASVLTGWLTKHPKATIGLNIGAGFAFIMAGLSIAFLK